MSSNIPSCTDVIRRCAILVCNPKNINILQYTTEDFRMVLPGIYECRERPFILLIGSSVDECGMILKRIFDPQADARCTDMCIMSPPDATEYWSKILESIGAEIANPVTINISYFWDNDLQSTQPIPFDRNGNLFRFLLECEPDDEPFDFLEDDTESMQSDASDNEESSSSSEEDVPPSDPFPFQPPVFDVNQ